MKIDLLQERVAGRFSKSAPGCTRLRQSYP